MVSFFSIHYKHIQGRAQRPPSLRYAADVSCFRDDIPIQSLNQASGGWVNVFLDLSFDCDGVVTGWQFYGTRAGIFFAGIWRLEGQNIRLIDKSRIVAVTAGITVCEYRVYITTESCFRNSLDSAFLFCEYDWHYNIMFSEDFSPIFFCFTNISVIHSSKSNEWSALYIRIMEKILNCWIDRIHVGCSVYQRSPTNTCNKNHPIKLESYPSML